jgi:hypothetical protein
MGEVNAHPDSRACVRFVYKAYEEEKAGLFPTRNARRKRQAFSPQGCCRELTQVLFTAIKNQKILT